MEGVRRVLERPVRVLVAAHLDEVRQVLDDAEALAMDGRIVAGFVSYDAAPAFDAALAASNAPVLPLAWFAAFDGWTEALTPDAPSETSPLHAETTLDDERYQRAVERIREYIAAGDVYQVNLTIPFVAAPAGSVDALYERMRRAQGGRYSAFIDTGDVQVLSASPELFFERHGRTLRCRPMKGTAPRAPSSAGDVTRRDALLASEKDRAENVMIVDLVRNDVGRVAETGSVRVTSLCAAERFPRVWQLTSSVEGTLSEGTTLADIFAALFPSGSITGAPKIRATQVIRELELSAREVYCGAVGVLEPGGDATFNVAIRTAWSTDGGASVRLDAGGGVTIDSTAAGELAEARTKLEAFTQPVPRGSLFETIRVERGVPLRLDAHLARLATSADWFGIPFDGARARSVMLDVASSPAGANDSARGRLVLAVTGDLAATVEPFVDGDPSEAQRAVTLAREPVSSDDFRLYHKLVDRRWYDQLLSESPQAFDVLLWNERDELTEFTRGNLVLELDGELFTPPLASGLLPGILRGELLAEGRVSVRVLVRGDLARATATWFVNALRGWVRVRWDADGPLAR